MALPQSWSCVHQQKVQNCHRSVKTVSCKAIGRSAWKPNQDKHLDKYLAFLGWIRASLRESAIFSNQEELSFSNNMFSHHDDIIIYKHWRFRWWRQCQATAWQPPCWGRRPRVRYKIVHLISRLGQRCKCLFLSHSHLHCNIYVYCCIVW